jgi:hypothetical protein
MTTLVADNRTDGRENSCKNCHGLRKTTTTTVITTHVFDRVIVRTVYVKFTA